MINILIVDDYKPFLEEACRVIGNDGTLISTARTSKDAIRQIQEQRFDLVITDLFMESHTAEDGLSVLRAAKRSEFAQVIVVTSFGKPELSEASMRLGAFDYIERGSPGTDFRFMLESKTRLALDYRDAKVKVSNRS